MMRPTDDYLFCFECCQIAAQAWANGDLHLADRAFLAALVTVNQCGAFIDLEFEEPSR